MKKELTAYKANQIIQLDDCEIVSWDDLTEAQRKLAMFTAARVEKNDDHDTQYRMTFKEYFDLTKNARKTKNELYEEYQHGGSDYKKIYRDVKTLAKSGAEFIDDEGRTIFFKWLVSPIINPNNKGEIIYYIDRNLMPFYKTQRGTFAIVQLHDYMPLRGNYTLKLYELLCSWRNAGTWYQTIEQLRFNMEVPTGKYPSPKGFYHDVFLRALAQINEVSQFISVEHRVKRGKQNAIEGIMFIIKSLASGEKQPDYTDMYKALQAVGVEWAQAKGIIESLAIKYPENKTYEKVILGNIEYARCHKPKNLPAMVLSAIQNDYAQIKQMSLFEQNRTVEIEQKKAVADKKTAELEQKISDEIDRSSWSPEILKRSARVKAQQKK